MLAEIHGGQGNHGVQVIGRSDHDAVDVLLLLEHLAIVGVPDGLAMGFRKPLHVGDLFHGTLPRFGSARGCWRSSALRRCWRCGQPLLGLCGVGGQLLEGGARVAPVHVAQRDDVLARQVDQIRPSHAPDADTGHVEAVAGCQLATAG